MRFCPVACARHGGSGGKVRSSSICSRGPRSADTASHGWESLILPCLLESRMRNERRTSGSGRGDEKPAAERRFGARRLLYAQLLLLPAALRLLRPASAGGKA